ncbi:SDR family NAD(P)-dependent oxidoreductase [uncultured Treponema sp.]|uniref:SDR family NAD(P)-dependent oxidoreductase n=1 Tax=uncultured Treponema sp. TaxID=162155 RepID=UPI0025F60677|nr:SDR family NAD(P)-dependent oxidoreductase [uncultured Treponema sp.]
MKKIIIVTGASSGMGFWFAKLLARESSEFEKFSSDELWIIARRKERLEELKVQIEKESSQEKIKFPEVKIFPIDISGIQGALKIKELFENEKSKGDFKINVLVNNAGFGTYGEFAQTDTMREMEMIDLDCTSLTGITGFALPYMQNGSRIINVASLASFLPLGNFAVYGACKSYVLSFSVALAAELKHKGIKVTALCPGPVSTEFADIASRGARKKVRHGLSPEKTVQDAIKCSRKGKLYSMKFFKWKFKAAASKFIGRYFGAWATYKFCKRPSN